MIRITGGRLRGRRIRVASGARTRPSAGRLREALFSALGARVEGARVADLFAGAGALGLEALSRGASHVLFVEIDPRSVRVLRENLRDLDVDPVQYRIHRGDARRWWARLAAPIEGDGATDPTSLGPPSVEGPADSTRPSLVLMDPPYQEDQLARLLPPAVRLVESARLDACVIEHPSGETPPSSRPVPLVRLITRAHGHGAFTLIERTSDP